jgi:CBS domain containing-hemolysin-like protein
MIGDIQILAALVAVLAAWCGWLLWRLHSLTERVADAELRLGNAVQTLFQASAVHQERVGDHEAEVDKALREVARTFVAQAEAYQRLEQHQLMLARRAYAIDHAHAKAMS